MGFPVHEVHDAVKKITVGRENPFKDDLGLGKNDCNYFYKHPEITKRNYVASVLEKVVL